MNKKKVQAARGGSSRVSKRGAERGSKRASAAPSKSKAKTTSTRAGRRQAIEEGPAVVTPTQEMIATRAFLIWERSGGDEVSNWVAAERELHVEARMVATRDGAARGSRTGRARRR